MAWVIILAAVAIILAIGGTQKRQDTTNRLSEEAVQLLLGPQRAAERRAKQRSDKLLHGLGRFLGWAIAIGGLAALLSVTGCANGYFLGGYVPQGGKSPGVSWDAWCHGGNGQGAECDAARQARVQRDIAAENAAEVAAGPGACNSRTPNNCLSPAQRKLVAPTPRNLAFGQCLSNVSAQYQIQRRPSFATSAEINGDIQDATAYCSWLIDLKYGRN
jgi:hypothetical protein